ncbi:CYFA0S38e00364g1_1 [Cyberlindnera fabianii]|uniref:CYFA0S38e00364g1_1 n=1 Tax=Cyberlindnera fabianii TaxID=36022 RepID=A0A061BL85_CYBFA|nr:CYFA0S38e00364g1_1 [Cyberlindnera fabianii]
METIDIHSRSFAVKWIQIPDGVTVMFQIKPIKRSVTFGVYRSAQDVKSEPSLYSVLDAESNNSSSTSLHRRRSNTSLSMEERLQKSSLHCVKSYGMLNGNEMFQGEFKVDKGGIFAFVFDNTFSKSYSKKVLFNKFFVEEVATTSTSTSSAPRSSSLKTSSTPSLTRKLSVSASSLNVANELHPNNGQYLQGYLLKKKRKKLQGFTKRYFVLNFKYNTLSYYLNEKTLKFRGEMQINLASVTAFKDENMIVIDSGMDVWILKTLNQEDWDNWINALNFIKLQASESKPTTTTQEKPKTLLSAPNTGFPGTTHLHDPLSGIDGSPINSATSSPAQLPTITSKKNLSGIDETLKKPELGEVLLNIDTRIDKLSLLLQRVNATTSSNTPELNSATSELSDLQSYVKSLLLQPPELVLSRQGSVFSDDYFDAEDGLTTGDESGDDLDNRVLLLPGGNATATYSVDDLSDQDDDSVELVSPQPAGDKGQTVDLYPLPLSPVSRRNTVKPSTSTPQSLFSFLRKNVGKDLSSISMPVTSNEPLTILQKLGEMFEHSDLLTQASQEENLDIKLIKISTFAMSNLGPLRSKERNLRKPFNPILGETYEMVNEKLGIRLISEKICHKPQIFAFHCESSDWELSFTLCPEQKFWGKSLELINKGDIILTLKTTGEAFKWQQPSTMLKNIIAGDRYSEPVNSMTVTSSSGVKSVVEFKKPQGGLFSTPRCEGVSINVLDKSGKKSSYFAEGNWTSEVYLKNLNEAKISTKIYVASELLRDESSRWGFSVFASNLNEITAIEQGKIPVTDSRFRPDVRAYENGDIKSAETLKLEIEQRQRERRKLVADAGEVHIPSFFKKVGSGEMDYEVIKGEEGYWEKRKRGDWTGLTELW